MAFGWPKVLESPQQLEFELTADPKRTTRKTLFLGIPRSARTQPSGTQSSSLAQEGLGFRV